MWLSLIHISVDKDLNNIENFCLDVGKYKVTVSYKNEKENFTYKVEDTTAPVITGAESIDICLLYTSRCV